MIIKINFFDDEMSMSLENLIQNYSVHEGELEFSILNTRSRTFHIPRNNYAKFMIDYCRGIDNKQIIPLGEVSDKSREIPLIGYFRLIFNDMDSKTDDFDHELYTTSFLLAIVKAYQDTIFELFYENGDSGSEYIALLCLSKPVLNYSDESEGGELTMQKIRIQFPWCRMNKKFYQANFLPILKNNLSRSKLENYCIETMAIPIVEMMYDYKDVIPLYGSEDSGSIIKLIGGVINDKDIEDNNVASSEMFKYFSWSTIKPKQHQYFQRCKAPFHGIDQLDYPPEYWAPIILSSDFYDRLLQPRDGIVSKGIKKPIHNPLTFEDVVDSEDPKDLLFDLTKILSRDRFKDICFWKELGEIAYKTFDAHPEMSSHKKNPDNEGFKWWVQMSLISESGFTEHDCLRYWKLINKEKIRLTVKRIAEYALQDNPVRYKEWHSIWVRKAYDNMFEDCSDEKMGRAFYRLHWLKFIFTSRGSKSSEKWYMFDLTRLIATNSSRIESEIKGLFRSNMASILSEYSTKMRNTNVSETVQRELSRMCSKISATISETEKNGVKTKIVRSASLFFEVPDFYNFKDKDPYLTGASNCVIEARDDEIYHRRGYIEDYITKNTHVPYYPDFGFDNPEVRRVQEIVDQIFVYNQEVIRFFWIFLASLLRGRNAEKHINIFIGDGDNGKSIILKMIKSCLGDYSIDFPSEILTCKNKGSSGSANPEISQAEGSKVAFISELNNDEKFASGPPKKYSGGDTIFNRGLYESGGSIEQTWKIIIATNIMMEFENADKALMERILVFPFAGRFMDEAPRELSEQIRTRQFPMDRNLENQIGMLTPAMLFLMAYHYKEYRSVKMKTIIPTVMKDYLEEYWLTHDIYLTFIDEVLIKHYDVDQSMRKIKREEPSISVKDVKNVFVTWFKERYSNSKKPMPTMQMIGTCLADPKRLGSARQDRKWGGISLKPEYIESED